jgi:AraC family transcriptional regulator
MINIEDSSYAPNMSEISEMVANETFDELYRYMISEYQALMKIEYSREAAFKGWNVKYRKSGRTLCTVYPRSGHFMLLLVVGQKEKQRVEDLLPEMSEEFRNAYNRTQEWMGQRWMMFDISVHTALLDDILKVVRIRRESK